MAWSTPLQSRIFLIFFTKLFKIFLCKVPPSVRVLRVAVVLPEHLLAVLLPRVAGGPQQAST